MLTEHKVINADNPFYQLNANFDLTAPSSKSVLVYLNGDLLIQGKDYNFNNQGFVAVTKTIALDDIIAVYEYETTDGCHVPETPTKISHPSMDMSSPLSEGIINQYDVWQFLKQKPEESEVFD